MSLTHIVLVSALAISWPGGDSSAEVEDSCVDCHRNPDFLVTNKKLYNYFQEWELSVHKQEEVACFDCHGGNPDIADKEKAHEGEVSGSETKSAVNFANIPVTCGQCHDDFYERYRKSPHFEHLVAKQQEDQGPNCVTCHGSINAEVLNVNTVRDACSRCHNEESENHPEIPEKAKNLLNKFLSIHRFYRYITVKGEPSEMKEFFEGVGARIYSLSVDWHTFDISKIEDETKDLLGVLKEKRDEVRKRHREKKEL